MTVQVSFHVPSSGRTEEDVLYGAPYASENLAADNAASDDVTTIVTDRLSTVYLTTTAAAYVAAAEGTPDAGSEPRLMLNAGTSVKLRLPKGYKVAARATS